MERYATGKITKEYRGKKYEFPFSVKAENVQETEEKRFTSENEMKNINDKIKEKPDKTDPVDNNTVEFISADTRENIKSGEKLNISFGKINKFFADLKAAAFCNVTNSITAGEDADVTTKKALKEVNNKFGGLYFAEDADGNKYVVGADSVPKKLGSDINGLDDIIGNNGFIELGRKNSHENGPSFPFQINLSQYPGYQNLTVDNFIFEVIDIQFGVYHSGSQTEYYVSGAGCSVSNVYREYDASTGILTINPNRSKGTYNDGTYPDRNCNLGSAGVQYFKAKLYLKSN